MKSFGLVISLLVACAACGQQRFDNVPELGNVHWYRDYDRALEHSEQVGKPVFILFQEVPGCSTCRNYGRDVLSEPLLVEAIEQYFIPLAIYNNKGGKDREVLDKYGEPSWNNPVVRIVNSRGLDIYPRLNGQYTAAQVTKALLDVLSQQGASIADYLMILDEALSARSTADAYYQMYCFWSGEKELAKMDGVVQLESGFMGGAEVVKVTYDMDKTSMADLTAAAATHKMKELTQPSRFKRSDKDVHYYLRNSLYSSIPMSPLQQITANTAIGNGQSPEHLLSPKQILWVEEVRKGSLAPINRIDQDYRSIWWDRASKE